MTELLLVLLAYSQDTEVHVFKDLNFRCGSPRNCPRVRSPNKRLTLAFTDGDRTFMVIAMKTDADLGTWVEAVETEQRTVFQKRKELVREDRKLASEACVFQKLDVVVNGIAATVYETLLVHQGIAYRLVAFGTEDSKAFLDDCDAWLKSFEFLGDRKEWLDQLEGKPARSALAGGLVSFPLNRPRWKEVTFDQDTEYGYLDEATFQILSGGAWVYVRIRETRRDAAAELEDLKHRFLGRLKNSKSTPFQVGEVSCVDVSGEFQGMRRSIRAAAFVREDLFVEVSLESVPTRYEATRLDWERLVRELQLQSRSSPKEPPAFSSRVYGSERKLDPGLQAFLPGARRFLPAAGNRTLLQISPDGATAAILLENRLFLQDVATGRLRPLPDLWTTLPHIAWSKDGARIATASIEEGIVVVEISSLQATRIDVPAFRVSFGPAENELLACTRTTKLTSAIQSGKLEVVRLPRGERRVFLEFPLSRIDLATPSPDGRSVALVCNKDYPRTATEGGHLYVCNADGSGLRQLTRDPEDISSVAWSPDGKAIYIVRRRQAGESGRVGWGGPKDVWRILPSDGSAANLTRSGHIERLWSSPAGLVFEIGDTWLLNPSQAGVFCMDAAALEKATSGRPEPKVFDPESAAEALSARIREKIGDVSQFIPTEASLAEIAEAFAAAAREICGVDLDFQPDSLDRLRDLQYRLSARNSALLLGIGACYGETIRRSFGAEWKLKPVPFADWAPRGTYEDNPLVQVVLPFTDAVASSLDSESYGMWSGDSFAEREQGQKVILVYPPSHAAAAAREAAGEDYFKARTLLDEGKVKDALDLLVKEMERRPRNRALAQTVIGICEAAEMPDAVLILTRRAVDAGNEVPDLLVRYADDLAKTDPARALPYYRKACSEYWQPAETLIKTGDAYAAAGNPAVAESCWRRAWRNAEEGEKREIRRRMGIPEPESE